MITANLISWQWGDVDATCDGNDVELTHRRTRTRLSVREGRLLRGDGYATASADVRHELARVGGIVRLRQRGRYLVHAAGVVDPLGRAWLLAGDSGCGKSTLGYALSRAGWASLGDDGVVIERDGRGFRAHAWHDALRVSRLLSDEFPELDGGESTVGHNDPRQRLSLPPAFVARGGPVAALIFLSRGERHSVRAIGPVAALGALIRQSPWVIIEDGHSRAHLEALRHAAMLPAFQLEHTRVELHTIADVLTRTVA
jgi:hypothetical protein